MLQRLLRPLLLIVSLATASVAAASDITIMSWNLKRLGHGHDQSFEAIAAIAGKSDLLAVQEVMDPAAVDRLELSLEKATGETWSTSVSRLVGSKAYKEAYAFAWRDSSVEYVDGEAVFIDIGNVFIREPYSARFKSKRSGKLIALATVHILYGNSPADRAPEIKALADYWTWLEEIYPDTPVMLVGDFNTPPNEPVWADMKRRAVPLITTGASTLSGRDGKFANLYDNVFVSRTNPPGVIKAGIVQYPKMLKWSHERARKQVSDHAPVFAILGGAKSAPGTSTSTSASTGAARLPPAPIALASAKQSIAGLLPQRAVAGAVRGNKKSHIYHRPDCPSYSSISAANQIEFASTDAAQQAGYRLAGNCK